MRNTRGFCFFTVFTVLMISAATALAHNGMEHVMGIISKLSASSLTVETVQHKTVVVLLDASTKFSQNETPASLQDLHIGDRVVVHAKPNAAKQLVGVTVKWGPASEPKIQHPAGK